MSNFLNCMDDRIPNNYSSAVSSNKSDEWYNDVNRELRVMEQNKCLEIFLMESIHLNYQ